jgi:hypothetical protein
MFNGTRCANSVAHSLNAEGDFDPSIKQINAMVKKFRTNIGPYKLLDEVKKKDKNPKLYL